MKLNNNFHETEKWETRKIFEYKYSSCSCTSHTGHVLHLLNWNAPASQQPAATGTEPTIFSTHTKVNLFNFPLNRASTANVVIFSTFICWWPLCLSSMKNAIKKFEAKEELKKKKTTNCTTFLRVNSCRSTTKYSISCNFTSDECKQNKFYVTHAWFGWVGLGLAGGLLQ